MKTIIFSTVLLCLFLITNSAATQTFKQSLELSAGRSFHGTGDLKGVLIDFSHLYQVAKNVGIISSATSTIHFRRDIYSSYTRDPYSATISGFQLSTSIRLNLNFSKFSELYLTVGPLFRFEVDSEPRLKSAIYDPNSPDPLSPYRFEFEDQSSYSPGYVVTLGYSATIKNKVRLGCKMHFQNDTMGSAITAISPSIGIILK